MNVNSKGYLHFDNKKLSELKRCLKILFLKALKFPVFLISLAILFCPTIAESLLASGQPIRRQCKVFVLSCDSLLSFCAILEASVEVTRC